MINIVEAAHQILPTYQRALDSNRRTFARAFVAQFFPDESPAFHVKTADQLVDLAIRTEPDGFTQVATTRNDSPKTPEAFIAELKAQLHSFTGGRHDIFPVDVLNNPMRKLVNGKWENAVWPSEAPEISEEGKRQLLLLIVDSIVDGRLGAEAAKLMKETVVRLSDPLAVTNG